jgi:hypothetical protein
MKRLLALAVALGVTLCSTVNAASLRVNPHSPTGVYSLYFNGGAENGNFDTIIVDILPLAGAQFLNTNSGNEASRPRPPGMPYTYINRAINTDPFDYPEGLGWTILGLAPTYELANGLQFTAGPLGGKINTSTMPNGELFLANIIMPPDAQAMASVQVVSVGTILQTLTATFPIPEPAAAGLATVALLSLAAIGRRWA